MKDKILLLRKQGKTYTEIQQSLKCSRGLISYYLNPDGKTKWIKRQGANRLYRKKYYKELLGGKCEKCGYNRCLDALQFHHKDPKTKMFEISSAIWGKKGIADNQILEEIKKCMLLCANCHAEIHSNNY